MGESSIGAGDMRIDFIKYIAALILFGTNGVVASAIALSSPQITLGRTALASCVMLFCLVMGRALNGRGQVAEGEPTTARDYGFVTASGACMAVSWILQYYAFSLLGVSVTSLIYCLGPLLVAVLSPVLFKETLSVRKVLCFMVVIGGVVLVNSAHVDSGIDSVGLGCSLGCALAYAAMIIFNKQSRNIGGVTNSAIQLSAAFAATGLFCLFTGSFPFALDDRSFEALVLLGVMNTGIGCYLYFSSLGALRAQTVAICDYIEPLTALLFSTAFLGERLASFQLLGAAVIVLGVLGSETWANRKRADCSCKPSV